jgi:hypothetical protein
VVTPGEAFDAPGYLRISYATSMEQLREGAYAHSALRRIDSAREGRHAVGKWARAQSPRAQEPSVFLTPCASVSESSMCSMIPGRSTRTPPTRSAVGHRPDVVVRPADTSEVSLSPGQCQAAGVSLVVRGAGTGYTGGAVPLKGGVVLSMARFDRILTVDEANLIAVVQPAVITADLQRAVEARGLFYPPDPASLESCSIGGNVAECAGGRERSSTA